MKIYIAGSMTDQEYLRIIRQRINLLGHEVTASWLDAGFAYGDRRCTASHMKHEAPRDVAEIHAADLFILNRRHRSAGKMTELGMAIAFEKRIWLVGPPAIPNVFYGYAERPAFPNWCSVFETLEKISLGSPAEQRAPRSTRQKNAIEAGAT